MLHQRVMECALSGGLPLCRLLSDAIKATRCVAERAACLGQEPTVGHPELRLEGYFVADHPEWLAHTCLLQRLGMPHGAFGWMDQRRRAAYRAVDPPPVAEPWLFGDLSQTAFATEDHLERLVASALDLPAWRTAVSRAMAAAVRERFTSGRLAGEIIRLVNSAMDRRDAPGADAAS
jgi:hypothetical protein